MTAFKKERRIRRFKLGGRNPDVVIACLKAVDARP
jgi:hypothetical protein